MARDVTRRFGEGDAAVDALRGVDARHRSGTAHGRHGPVRLGQVHADAHPRRPRHADRGQRRDRRRRDHRLDDKRAHAAAPRQDRLRLPVLQPAADARRPRRTSSCRWRSPAGSPTRPGSSRLIDATSASPTACTHRPRSSPAASSSASRSRGRSSPGRASCSPTSPPATSTRTTSGEILELLRRSVDELGQTIVMVTHDPRAASIADRVAVPRRRPHRARPRAAPTPTRSSTTMKELELRVIRVVAPGALDAQAALGADRARDRARRRDDRAALTPHGPDQRRRSTPSSRPSNRHRRVVHRQDGVRHRATTSGGDAHAVVRESLLAKVRALPEVAGRGRRRRRPAALSSRTARRSSSGGARTSASSSLRAAAVQLRYALQGRLPTDRRGRGRQGTASKNHLTVGDTIGVAGRRPGASRSRSSASSSSPPRLDRRRDVRRFDLPDRPAAVRQAGQARPHPRRRAQPGISPTQLVSEIRRSCPPARRCRRAPQQAKKRREAHERVPLVPQDLPARVRRHRAVRRRVRHLQLALDHGRAAHARVRHAAHARRDAAQVLRAGPVEALVIGRLASVAGLSSASRSRKGLFKLFDAIGFSCRTAALIFQTRTIVVSLARRRSSSRCSPASAGDPSDAGAADRGGARGRELPPARLRPLAARRARRSAALGFARSLYGLFGHRLDVQRLLWMGLGALLVFVGVALLPRASPPAGAAPRLARRQRFGGTAGPARARERPAQPAAHGLDGGGADDRPRARHVRRVLAAGIIATFKRRRERLCTAQTRGHRAEQLLADPDAAGQAAQRPGITSTARPLGDGRSSATTRSSNGRRPGDRPACQPRLEAGLARGARRSSAPTAPSSTRLRQEAPPEARLAVDADHRRPANAALHDPGIFDRRPAARRSAGSRSRPRLFDRAYQQPRTSTRSSTCRAV